MISATDDLHLCRDHKPRSRERVPPFWGANGVSRMSRPSRSGLPYVILDALIFFASLDVALAC
jgi:hypothetical protein